MSEHDGGEWWYSIWMLAICYILNRKSLLVCGSSILLFRVLWQYSVFLSVEISFVTPQNGEGDLTCFNPIVPVTFLLTMSDSPVLPKSINMIVHFEDSPWYCVKCGPRCLLSYMKMLIKLWLKLKIFYHDMKHANLLTCFFRLRLPNSSSCLLQRMLKSSVYRISFCIAEPSTMTSQREVPLRRLILMVAEVRP